MYSGDQLWWNIPFGSLPLCYYNFWNNYCLLLWKIKYLSIYPLTYLMKQCYILDEPATLWECHVLIFTMFVMHFVVFTMLRPIIISSRVCLKFLTFFHDFILRLSELFFTINTHSSQDFVTIALRSRESGRNFVGLVIAVKAMVDVDRAVYSLV